MVEPDLSALVQDAVAQQDQSQAGDFTFDPCLHGVWPEGDFGNLFNIQLGELDSRESILKRIEGVVTTGLMAVGDDLNWFAAL